VPPAVAAVGVGGILDKASLGVGHPESHDSNTHAQHNAYVMLVACEVALAPNMAECAGHVCKRAIARRPMPWLGACSWPCLYRV
jgi:peptidoglycan/LPS O-acetylase OafA/YrhL